MRHLAVLVSVGAMLMGLFADGRGATETVAQDATPAGLAGHPVVRRLGLGHGRRRPDEPAVLRCLPPRRHLR